MKPLILSSENGSDHINFNLGIFKSFGYDVKKFKFLNPWFFKRESKIVYLNWYENLETEKPLFVLFKFFFKVITLYYIRYSRLVTITSFHNKEAHAKICPSLAKYLFELVIKVSDHIIVFNKCGYTDLERYLSKEEIERKARLVPPVNYIGHYPFVRHEWINRIQERHQMKVLFAGRMNQAYKNVPMIMEIAKRLQDYDICFVFAGNAKECKNEYLRLTEGLRNVVTELRYVKDDEMAHLLEMCDLLIIPYNVESISNSGTARLAFSYARTVICPDIPFLEDIPHDLIYTYTYSDRADHKRKVEETILKAYNDWTTDAEVLHKKGSMLKQIMEKENSPEVITQKYRSIFNEINYK